MRTRARACSCGNVGGGVENRLAARLRREASLFAVDPLLFVDQWGPHFEDSESLVVAPGHISLVIERHYLFRETWSSN